MRLPTDLAKELQTPDLAVNERARLSCRIAQHYEQAGDYDAASEAMAEFWRGVGVRPDVEELRDAVKGEVLLRVGSLTGLIGSTKQIEGSQEAAKDLISEAMRLFESWGMRSKVAEARSDLALCYWRAGALDEARVTLEEALREFDENDIEPKARALLRLAEVERVSKRFSAALRVYDEVSPLFLKITDPMLLARLRHGYGTVLNQLSAASKDYVDRALMEYTATSLHLEEAGHERYQACVENNLGFLFSTIGRYDEAHEHLDRCQVLLTKIADTLRLGHLDETRARVFLAEGKLVEAEKVARAAAHTLANGDRISWYAEALTTHGIALARLQHPHEARAEFEEAINVAQNGGDFESAGLAALALIEEVKDQKAGYICQMLEHTRVLLEKADDADTLRRLAKAACYALFVSQKLSLPPDWTHFSLKKSIRDYEKKVIRAALIQAEGSVTVAARLLGYDHHQTLTCKLETRHRDLLPLRSEKLVRRKHLMQHPKK